jgi:hypothetical protein
MINIFQDRHSGMDSRQAILPDALRVNANLFQTDLCRNPGSMDGLSLPSMALDTRFPVGMTSLHKSDKVELIKQASENQNLNAT